MIVSHSPTKNSGKKSAFSFTAVNVPTNFEGFGRSMASKSALERRLCGLDIYFVRDETGAITRALGVMQ